MITRKFFVSILFLATSASSLAVPVDDLYVGEVLVASQEDDQLKAGARAGLMQVLVRVSGSTEIESHPLIAAALDKPQAYYYQYGYASTDRTLMVGDQVVPARMLRLTFEPSAVSRLLRQAGFPVWGSNRPGVLLWVAVNEGEGRRLLSEADTSPVLNAINTEAQIRGLPTLLPLLDLEDAAQLSPAEVWGLFLDRVDVASLRYKPDAVLAGRVQREAGGQWTGRWFYRIEDRWQGLDNIAEDEESLVIRVVDQIADELARRYAVDASRGSLILRVEGIAGLEDYAAVLQYLESLTPVVASSVLKVEGNEVLFSLDTEGATDQLREIIGLDEKMILISASGTNSRENPTQYRWIGNGR